MSLTGALLAVFIQQWALSYLDATQRRDSPHDRPHDRARVRAFHGEGLEKLDLNRVTRAVPILIHVSIFLFFAGLPVFLFNVSRTVFNVVVAWLAICVVGYACITLMPIFYQNSPYYSPLSSSIWWCVTYTPSIIYPLLVSIIYPILKFIIYPLFKLGFITSPYRFLRRFEYRSSTPFHWPSLRAMQQAAGRFARGLPSKIDYDALGRMFETLNEDDELEQFFDALPSLCESTRLEDAKTAFIKPNEQMLKHALIGMMDRSLLSELVSEEVKQRRIIICTKVINAASLLGPLWTLRRVLFRDWHGFSKSIHFGLFVQGWKKIPDPVIAFYAQFVVAVTLASVQRRDDHWFELASGQLKESKSLLQDYFAQHGDSIQLANLIFITRRAIQINGLEGDHRNDIHEALSETLKLICRFDIQKTLPELQHQFCSLWNQLLDAAQNATFPPARIPSTLTLRTIRRLYITLHENTSCSPTAFTTRTDDRDTVLDDARSYPRCTIDGHRHSDLISVPELQLDGPPRNTHHAPDIDSSKSMMPGLSSALVPVGSSTKPSSAAPIIPAAKLSHPGLLNPYFPIAPGPPVFRRTRSPSRHRRNIIPQDGFIPRADYDSTIRLPPPHELAQPVAPPGPYYPYPRFSNSYLQCFF